MERPVQRFEVCSGSTAAGQWRSVFPIGRVESLMVHSSRHASRDDSLKFRWNVRYSALRFAADPRLLANGAVFFRSEESKVLWFIPRDTHRVTIRSSSDGTSGTAL